MIEITLWMSRPFLAAPRSGRGHKRLNRLLFIVARPLRRNVVWDYFFVCFNQRSAEEEIVWLFSCCCSEERCSQVMAEKFAYFMHLSMEWRVKCADVTVNQPLTHEQKRKSLPNNKGKRVLPKKNRFWVLLGTIFYQINALEQAASFLHFSPSKHNNIKENILNFSLNRSTT